MNFLLILLALAVELMIYSFESWRSAKWSNDWIVWLARVLGRFRWWQGPWGAALALALPALGIGMFFAVVSGWSALLGVFASVVCLLLTLGQAISIARSKHISGASVSPRPAMARLRRSPFSITLKSSVT